MQDAAREVALAQARAKSFRLEDDDGNKGAGLEAGAAAFGRVKSPRTGHKHALHVLGWRFRDIFRLWRIAHKAGRREDLIFFGVCVANVIAQVISLSLPVYSGKIVSELTGGDSHGEVANGAQLARNILEALAIILVYIVLSCAATLTLMLSGIRWRGALTQELHRLYLLSGRSLAFYKIQLFDCDNTDQRIAADTATFVKLCCGGVSPPYPSVLTSLIQNVSLAIAATGFCVVRAGWRVTLISYAYNILTIALNTWISLPMAASTAAQEAREGDFRYGHLRLQTYAESIAFYGAQRAEHAQLESELQAVLGNQKRLTLQYFRLLVAITFSQVGGGLIGLLIASFAIWSGKRTVYNIAELSAVLGTLDLLTMALQALPGLLPQITTIAGLSKRVIELHRALESIASAPPPRVSTLDSAETLGCSKLSLSTPDGRRKLMSGLDLTVSRGASVVIVGDSGCGKSSLLRVLAGLWDADEGEIFRPLRAATMDARVFFLPQKPYMSVGSLRDQVLYPLLQPARPGGGGDDDGEGADVELDARILEILRAVELDAAATQFGLDAVEPWEDTLSVGEQQRLCFARVLFHRPKFVIMDESTAALDMRLEAKCMQLVVDAGITLLSVAHRPSVVRYHDLILRVKPEGGFQLSKTFKADGAN